MARVIADIFRDLAETRERIRDITETLAPLQDAEASMRAELHELMKASETKTIEGSGLQAIRSRRKSVIVSNEHELRVYLAREGLEGAYMKLDMTSVKKDAAKHGWPGVEEVATDVLSIREAKP